MAEITNRLFGIAFESSFKKAVIFKDAHCDEISQKCLEAFASYGLRPHQIAVKNGDQTYNYDLTFSLFNGNGTFKISAEKLDISLQNAMSNADLEIMQDCVAKIYEHVALPEINSTSIVATAHATFASIERMQEYFLRYANPTKQIVSGGTIAFIVSPNWEEEIRLAAEKSLGYQDGVFLMWTTIYRGGKISRDLLRIIKDTFEESAAKLDLTFSKPNSQ